jgi:hypothetical protein
MQDRMDCYNKEDGQLFADSKVKFPRGTISIFTWVATLNYYSVHILPNARQ